MSGQIRLLVCVAVSIAAGLGAAPATTQQTSEEELARLRDEIARLERDLARQIDRRDDGSAQLKAVEVSLAASRGELASLGESIRVQVEHRERIEAERETARRSLAGEQTALAEQVRLSYMTGRRELVRLLLSEENPADLGRMLVYYDYLNRHRGERIATVDAQLMRLAGLAVASDAATAELEALRSAEQAEADRLELERRRREELIAGLDAGIESSAERIERMRAEEAELNEVIARLAALLEEFPVSSETPFFEQRGNLRWPVEGRIAAEFGDFRDRAGRVRWNGVLLEAGAGTPVRAAYHGRVIHSQWTPGMGLLLILDHGDEYMTVYGHNAALHREPGDWVAPGEIIAEVGDTGGQLGTALYFEVRLDGEAIDPADWFR